MTTQTADPMAELASRLIQAIDNRPVSGEKSYGRYGQFMGVGYKHDSGGSPISVGYTHGPGGNLSFPGVDPVVFHTVVGNRGILGQLPTVGSPYMNPTYPIITGVSAASGSEKTDVCDDAPVAGLMATCIITSVFGRYERATQEIELNRLNQRVDRADPMDLTLVGSPIAESGIFTSGPGNPNPPSDLLRNETARKFWELGVAFARLLAVQVWQGNPANNTSGGGYKEMTGLDILIGTGHVDAQTGTACAAADSDVKDFNYLNVADNGSDVVNALTYIYYTRKDLADRTGVQPVRWVWCMRPEVFYELTAVWPCAYMTYRCNLLGIDGARINIDAMEQTRMRDEMRAGKYLLIDGERIEVIVDDGIEAEYQTTNANVTSGCFSSTIYLVPMSVAGGRAVTYMEYFEYSNPAIEDALGNLVLGRIEGPWITVPRQTNWCIQWQTKIEPRMVLRTPWLAGRLNNVQVCPLQMTRSPFPGDPYYVGGGVESRPGPSYYTQWNA